MFITATELKSNLGKYLLLAAEEDIYITRNGKVVAKLSNPNQDRVDIAKSLFGILPADITLEKSKQTVPKPFISMTEEEMLQRLQQSRESARKGNYRNAETMVSDIM